MQIQENKNLLIELAIKAGKETLKYFRKNFNVNLKADNSPVTIADISANEIIIEGLKKTNIAIISEEIENLSYQDRKNLKKFWIIDPLDGTKQFVKGEDEYTINIALVCENTVVEGVVFAPAKSELYYGNVNSNAVKIDTLTNKIENITLDHKIKIPKLVISKSHLNSKTTNFVNAFKEKFPESECENLGSSLKLCAVANNSANIYLRIGQINEWDIAAGHAVLKAAGGNIFSFQTGKEIIYNSENLKTPDFFAIKDLNFKNKIIEIYKNLS
ncbi:MAG TPA: 3'(2'),5'-bisphosphate nucleotidase CysQ [Bacteroidales bacterium]|nr:3'(2'),5'-bisphosphate nucleotidase CysQ [Bacteroidales bacterium]HQB20951.1 3'(2'),5'-bisphosphate nucleotidase CysQ [Bacteroidales bacterium]